GYSGGTPPGTNGVFLYTDQAMELQAPIHHQGSPLATTDSGAFLGQVSTYKYYTYSWKYDFWPGWHWERQTIYDNTSSDCDGAGFDPDCVCVSCTGQDITSAVPTRVTPTCGVGDVNDFATNPPGNPGYSASPWDGQAWNGVNAATETPYSALKCTKTVNYGNNNHRSWHSVMQPTGRTAAVRDLGGDTAAFLPPWNAGIGTQTMYCSDCHGSDTAAGTAMPNGGEDGNPWGPHGSNNDFLLKGGWDDLTGTAQPDGICFKCHNYDAYANPSPLVDIASGFSRSISTPGGLCAFGGPNTGVNLHTAHAMFYNIPGYPSFRCTACHVAVPHGWKNKALLVNLNDVGPEAGLPPGTEILDAQLPYSNEPYYLNAVNYIYNFKPSGQWDVNDCGSANAAGQSAMLSVCNTLP
ncbi:MAG: hypothetical protein L3J62_08390, partial [Gammaproteobacteria bacterium]|nr:hypothetical protein [Gammaproteobacteria bacterium]